MLVYLVKENMRLNMNCHNIFAQGTLLLGNKKNQHIDIHLKMERWSNAAILIQKNLFLAFLYLHFLVPVIYNTVITPFRWNDFSSTRMAIFIDNEISLLKKK